tara:strand:- start:63627 stop:64388 length:762 start_codon:yes stop_codon:yes gene_type:complete
MGLIYQTKSFLYKLQAEYLKVFAKPNKKAIWVFGVQKSGTTAITALISKRSGKSATLDTPMLWEPYYSKLLSGELHLIDHIKHNPYTFSRQIIKEPVASLFIKELKTYFEMNKYVMIYRDPHDVIRSILNRLGLPGNKKNVNIKDVNKNWRVHFGDGKDYIKSLTTLWINVYKQNEIISDDKCIFVKYEDFLKNKMTFIDNLVDQLNLPKKHDITEDLDFNFQVRGDNDVDLIEFFGSENYEYIKTATKKYVR